MRTLIIGGGASGLAAACMLCNAGEKPVLLEKQPRVGRKLLSTGNGRCNLSNLNASVRYYHGDKRILGEILGAFSPWDAMDFFADLGLESSADEEGRVYPLSNQAAGVLDALRLYLTEHDCEPVTDFEASAIERRGRKWAVRASDGRVETGDRVIIACGGLAAPKLGGCGDGYRLLQSLGHSVTPRYPAIAALKTPPEPVRGLKGIRMHGRIELIIDGKAVRTEDGEVLFSENGVSGIAAMQMARDVNLAIAKKKKCTLRLSFFPDGKKGFLKERVRKLPDRSMEDFLSGIVPKRLGQSIISAAGIRPMSIRAGELDPARIARLEDVLTGWEIPVTGTLSFDNAQVTCGGVPLNEFNAATLESLKASGVYAAGEVLDADGDCGGFNLQWAWASAHAAVQAILRERSQ